LQRWRIRSAVGSVVVVVSNNNSTIPIDEEWYTSIKIASMRLPGMPWTILGVELYMMLVGVLPLDLEDDRYLSFCEPLRRRGFINYYPEGIDNTESCGFSLRKILHIRVSYMAIEAHSPSLYLQ
jgi:hypothetical protein